MWEDYSQLIQNNRWFRPRTDAAVLSFPSLFGLFWWLSWQLAGVSFSWLQGAYNEAQGLPEVKSSTILDLDQGFPTPRPWTGTCPWPVRNWATQQEVTGCQNRNHSPQPLSVEKLSSVKPVPGAKKVGDLWPRWL